MSEQIHQKQTMSQYLQYEIKVEIKSHVNKQTGTKMIDQQRKICQALNHIQQNDGRHVHVPLTYIIISTSV